MSLLHDSLCSPEPTAMRLQAEEEVKVGMEFEAAKFNSSFLCIQHDNTLDTRGCKNK